MYEQTWASVHRGDLNAALLSVEQALRKDRNPRSQWRWRFWALKGEILMLQGRYEGSLSALNLPLPQFLAGSDIAVWQKLTEGAAAARLGRFDEAASLLQGAESLSREYHPELIDECILRLGTLYFHRGEPVLAYSTYKRALQLGRERHDAFLEVAALGSLAVTSTRLEHYDESIAWNKEARDLARTLQDARSASRIEGNSAWSYHEVGDLENALMQFQQAEEDAQKAGLVADRVYWLNSAAGTQYDLRHYSEAETLASQALQLAQQLKDDSEMQECYQNLALIAISRGQFAEAHENIESARRLEGSAPDQLRRLYTRLIGAHLAVQEGNLTLAEKSFPQINADPVSSTSIRWEAQAYLAEVHATMGNTALAEREFGESIKTIAKARNSLQNDEFRLSFLSSAIEFYDAYVNFLIAQKRPLDALKVADLSRAQTLEYGLSGGSSGKTGSTSALRPQDVARRLNATLLFYWLGEQRSYLWAITPTKVALVPLPKRAEIDAAVKSYRESFTDPRDPLEAGNADGRKLYATLIQPAEKLIAKNSRVVILADGSLNSLNFETLIVPGPQPHYWIEDVTLLTANSLSLLSRTSLSAPPKSANLFLLGDALAASPDFPPLPQAGKEVGLVEDYFPADRRLVLTGAQATASRFLDGKPGEFSYVHFATHGTASTTRPLESAVILSPEGDTYKLYARDIVQHPLKAYLVTISACNGAGMRTYAGEGLVGLAWAFLRAGAHNVIAGLWEVSNASTPQLMDELYKGLHAGQDPATALRNAKLSLVHSTGNYRRPFYWAPFQLYAGS